MNDLEIKAEEIRLPERARVALEQGTRVRITRYGQPTGVLLNRDTYSLVEPLLDLIEAGAVISPEMLMTKSDIALAQDLAEDRDTTPGEQSMIDDLLAESAR